MWKCLAIAILGTLLAQVAAGQAPVSPYSKADSLSVGPWRGEADGETLPWALLLARAKLAYVEPSGRLTIVDLKAQTKGELSHPLTVSPKLLTSGSPDDSQLLVAADVPGSGGQIVKLDVESGAVLSRMQLPERTTIGGLRISRATGHVAVLTAEQPRRLMLFDGAKGTLIFSVEARSARFVTFRPDGQQVITSGLQASSRQGLIEFWNAGSGAKERELVIRPSSPFVASGRLAISPDASLFVVQQLLPDGVLAQDPAQNGATAVLIRAEDGAQIGVLQGHEYGILSLQFSDDGARILTGSVDRTVRLWNGRDGTPVATLDGYPRLNRPIGNRDVVAAMFAPGALHPIWPFGPDAIISVTGDGEYVFWENSGHRQLRLASQFTQNLALAERGDILAMSLVSRAFDEGQGTARDPVQAEAWLRRLSLVGRSTHRLGFAARLIDATGASQDCGEASQLVRKAQAPERPTESMAMMTWDLLENLRNRALQAIGGTKAAASLAPTIQADLLETQMLEALKKQDHKNFLANLCALEFLGHADTMPAAARQELLFHRAVALRAERKPLPALTALNAYLGQAGRGGANYPAALQMLRPLQTEAAP